MVSGRLFADKHVAVSLGGQCQGHAGVGSLKKVSVAHTREPGWFASLACCSANPVEGLPSCGRLCSVCYADERTFPAIA